MIIGRKIAPLGSKKLNLSQSYEGTKTLAVFMGNQPLSSWLANYMRGIVQAPVNASLPENCKLYLRVL